MHPRERRTVRPVIHVLTGVTAAGKTAAALAWAGRFGAEIVSCDSLLFYRGLDIGTAKPTAAERAQVPHHLIDIMDVTARMDVREYVSRARVAIADIHARGRAVLVTGGSGFYLRSFFAAVADELEIDEALRATLEADQAREGNDALVRRLRELNPAGLGTLDVSNPRRVARALERCLLSGRPLVELAEEFRARSSPFAEFDVRLVELTREPDELRERITRRVQAMLAAGLIDEVRRLRASGLEENPSAARAIGYRETLAWLDAGGRETGGLASAIAQNTWRLVRKQRTWFRTQLPAHSVVGMRGEDLPDLDLLFAR